MSISTHWIDIDPTRPGYQGYLALPLFGFPQ